MTPEDGTDKRGRERVLSVNNAHTLFNSVSSGATWVLKALLRSAAAGFVFGEAASFTVEPAWIQDVALLSTATLASGRAGSAGVAVVTACLAFTSVLLSLGMGFLLSATVLKLLNTIRVRLPWLTKLTTGTSVVVGAVTSRVLVGHLPPWIYLSAQGTLVLIIYSYSNINVMTTALLIIFTTLYLSVLYGRIGALLGLICTVITTAVLPADIS